MYNGQIKETPDKISPWKPLIKIASQKYFLFIDNNASQKAHPAQPVIDVTIFLLILERRKLNKKGPTIEINAGIDWNEAYSNVDKSNSIERTFKVADPYAMIPPNMIDPHIKTSA